MELTMDISTDGDWSSNWLDIAFFDQDILDFLAHDPQFPFWEDGTVLYSFQPVVGVACTHIV